MTTISVDVTDDRDMSDFSDTLWRVAHVTSLKGVCITTDDAEQFGEEQRRVSVRFLESVASKPNVKRFIIRLA